MTDKEQTKSDTKEFATIGQAFIEQFNHVRASVMGMQGKPTAAAFRDVANHARELAHRADTLAGFLSKAEEAIDNATNAKFASPPDDPTAKWV